MASKGIVVVQGAMPSELDDVLAALGSVRHEKTAGFDFYRGELDGRAVLVSQAGKGVANTAAALAVAQTVYGPLAAVINQGTAGGHDPTLRVGDVVLGTHAVNVGAFKTPRRQRGEGSDTLAWQPMDLLASDASAGEDPNALRMRRFEADPGLLAAARRVAADWREQRPDVAVAEGGIASSEVWNSELDRVEHFRSAYQTLCEEMETATAAQLCRTWGVPFLGVRALTNNITNGGGYDIQPARTCQQFVVALLKHCP